MPSYTVRVEFRGDQPGDYEKLQTAMGRNAFAQTVTGDDGVAYHLPSAEFRANDTPLTIMQIRNLVLKIADLIRPGAWVFVTQGELCAWGTEAVGASRPAEPPVEPSKPQKAG